MNLNLIKFNQTATMQFINLYFSMLRQFYLINLVLYIYLIIEFGNDMHEACEGVVPASKHTKSKIIGTIS